MAAFIFRYETKQINDKISAKSLTQIFLSLSQDLGMTWQVLSKAWPGLDKSCPSLGYNLKSFGLDFSRVFLWVCFDS